MWLPTFQVLHRTYVTFIVCEISQILHIYISFCVLNLMCLDAWGLSVMTETCVDNANKIFCGWWYVFISFDYDTVRSWISDFMKMCRIYNEFFMYSYIQQQENSLKFKFCMCTVQLKFVNISLFVCAWRARITRYINWAMDWMIRNRSLICSMGKRFFCTLDYPYWFWVTPNHLCTRVLSLGVKWPQHEADHLPLSRAEFKNGFEINKWT